MLERYNRLSTFVKINLILVMMLLPLLVLNYLSNQTSNKVVRNEILRSSETYLALLTNQIDTTMNQMSTFVLGMNRDSAVRSYLNYEVFQEPYDKLVVVSNILEKLNLNSSSMPWTNQIAVYSPISEEAISTSGKVIYDAAFLKEHMNTNWELLPEDYRYGHPYFIRHFIEPRYSVNRPLSSYQLITEITFPVYELVKSLDQFKNKGNVHDPFLFKPGEKAIINTSSNTAFINTMVDHLLDTKMSTSGYETIVMQNNKYIVTYQLSSALGWYLVDYVPLDEVLAPINRSSHIFVGSVIILVFLGLAVSYFIYRNVQIPIIKLLSGARAIARGDFSTQISYRARNEFYFLILQFNTMATQIKELIETVYESKIRLQEATLKQLQSQVDPHFLYNSLNFIQYSAKNHDEEAVISMTLQLGAYYRYATRLGEATTTLQEEMNLIKSYLEIHKLRMYDMDYEIVLPPSMNTVEIPRLILQPVVENAIVHGISNRSQASFIKVSAESVNEFHRITVEDNGPGLTSIEQEELLARIMHSSNDHNMCGLWNVAQRLILKFGEEAGVSMEQSSYGGLKLTLYWPNYDSKDGI
ncbi:two-component system sensor histidine kinase YesM [Paenibacillus rhizosphaerae]|uniref:Two-component system sensor histidine kinase YesM n=1 Tax=Paenibacillus rhizosphaerae TaxID=297318 RepID=A0A839TFN3_9BACL|nr:sensor histidine kinase [Paenibacillus rhizosphaerae]MBB3125402.1 two-component system sensor histidine kinase YesM [Paenibacillus rhizosphaerae]